MGILTMTTTWSALAIVYLRPPIAHGTHWFCGSLNIFSPTKKQDSQYIFITRKSGVIEQKKIKWGKGKTLSDCEGWVRHGQEKKAKKLKHIHTYGLCLCHMFLYLSTPFFQSPPYQFFSKPKICLLQSLLVLRVVSA